MTYKDLLIEIEKYLSTNKKGSTPYLIAALAKRQLLQENPDLAPTEKADDTPAETEDGLADIAGDTTGKKSEDGSENNSENSSKPSNNAPAGTTDIHTDLNPDFGHALQALHAGCKVTRKGWNGKGLWLELQLPDANSKMTLPYIYLNYPANSEHTPNARVPWLASQTDALANDWEILK